MHQVPVETAGVEASAASPALIPRPVAVSGEQDRLPSIGPRFTLTFGGTALGLLLAILAINALGNGEGIFPTPIRPPLTDRALKARHLAEMVQQGEPPAILILGSSRVMQLRPDYIEAITGLPTYNLAVTGANVLDCLAMFRHACHLGIRPEMIILNIDEGMLDCWVTPANLRLAGDRRLLGSLPWPERAEIGVRAMKGITLESTVQSLQHLAAPARRLDEWEADRLFDLGDFLFLSDGYRINRQRALARAEGRFDLPAEIRRDLLDRTRNGAPGWFDPEKPLQGFPNPRMIEILRMMLTRAKSLGIEVRLISTPEHPAASEVGDRRGALRLRHDAMAATLRSMCADLGFTYRDFSDLASFGGSPDEFWDSIHQTPENLSRMTNALFRIAPGQMVKPVPTEIELLRRQGD